ncbi:MAG: PadR family transcriptional regulator [Candidatus Heimdallarchaeota archaeon]|nr:PadR family transcriptional regulator [Candidatus Heimdallarchaeota archaeon]
MSEDKNRTMTNPRPRSAITKSWERDLRRGLLQLMILMLIRLRTEEAHGYGLIKLIRETGIELKAGTIYPLLSRLEKDGLISSILADDNDSPGLPRRIYTITLKGEDMIEEMIDTYFDYHSFVYNWYQEITDQKKK